MKIKRNRKRKEKVIIRKINQLLYWEKKKVNNTIGTFDSDIDKESLICSKMFG